MQPRKMPPNLGFFVTPERLKYDLQSIRHRYHNKLGLEHPQIKRILEENEHQKNNRNKP